MTVISWIAIGAWIAWPPLSPAVKPVTAASSLTEEVTPDPTRRPWFAVILSGVLGAAFSGFSSSIASDQKKNRIPDELSTSTVTFARFSLAMYPQSLFQSFFYLAFLIFRTPALNYCGPWLSRLAFRIVCYCELSTRSQSSKTLRSVSRRPGRLCGAFQCLKTKSA